ncbi:hypothetical protein Q5794_06305 [Priestia megaterium]|uniref:hypothetical protein n=1 Tax=Priestia megaterium TaxID=1404 RepID=UPI0035BE4FD6
MIGGQGEDSCGKSGIGETPQELSDEEAHQPPAESEVLHGNQQRCNKQSRSLTPFVRLKIGSILLCVELVKGNREFCLKYTVF